MRCSFFVVITRNAVFIDPDILHSQQIAHEVDVLNALGYLCHCNVIPKQVHDLISKPWTALVVSPVIAQSYVKFVSSFVIDELPLLPSMINI